jgi:hypothetical protein
MFLNGKDPPDLIFVPRTGRNFGWIEISESNWESY